VAITKIKSPSLIIYRRILKASAPGKKTPKQSNDLQEKRNVLHRRIEGWRQVQTIYMPAVPGLRAAATPSALESDVTHPESSILYLPSQLGDQVFVS
jgi:hypothetical protein